MIDARVISDGAAPTDGSDLDAPPDAPPDARPDALPDAPPDAPYVCGDGIQDPNEACDDGNASNTDACLVTCVAASCPGPLRALYHFGETTGPVVDSSGCGLDA